MSWFYPLWAVVTVALVVLLVRSHLKADRHHQTRGTEPGQGDQLVEGGFQSGGPGGGHSTVTRVTRDPQKYAKAFVPEHAKKKR